MGIAGFTVNKNKVITIRGCVLCHAFVLLVMLTTMLSGCGGGGASGGGDTPTGTLSLLTGSTTGPGNFDGVGAAASFYEPRGVAVSGDGTVYVADAFNNKIRKISPAGVVTTLAGSGLLDSLWMSRSGGLLTGADELAGVTNRLASSANEAVFW